ncbi:hypothetical protein DM826_07325 [Halonotius aquaticus]|uniref:Uncharacterized protein n=1 Tax=Halonotius aquaticus TaxID=2216978 RepID=A0A3A6PXX1_9EURY|nr:hypothetical protein [Halonotius aquaticus]RJX43109.1 hypothetical protein DM826_07325 [Halonotius aquaticus]
MAPDLTESTDQEQIAEAVKAVITEEVLQEAQLAAERKRNELIDTELHAPNGDIDTSPDVDTLNEEIRWTAEDVLLDAVEEDQAPDDLDGHAYDRAAEIVDSYVDKIMADVELTERGLHQQIAEHDARRRDYVNPDRLYEQKKEARRL